MLAFAAGDCPNRQMRILDSTASQAKAEYLVATRRAEQGDPTVFPAVALTHSEREDGKTEYVRGTPGVKRDGDRGRFDWEFTHTLEHVLPLSHYWCRRFRNDMLWLGRCAHWYEVPRRLRIIRSRAQRSKDAT